LVLLNKIHQEQASYFGLMGEIRGATLWVT